MKKFLLMISLCLLLSACSQKTDSNSSKFDGNNSSTDAVSAKCTPGSVDLENYTDKGKRLPSCFVEYPGEPSRQDKSYYIIEDICGQFTKDFVANLLGKEIVRVKPSPVSGISSCSYYLNDKDYVMLVLDYLSVADQKKGLEILDRKVVIDQRIPMENFYAQQEDGKINSIYLVLNPDKFIRIERSSSKVLEGDQVLQFAAKLGGQIKNYK